MKLRIPKLLSRFRRDTSGTAVTEYVIIFTPLMMFIFFIFEITLAYHWALSAQKAVENGVRTAAVTAPVVNELQRTNGIGNTTINRDVSAGGEIGGACFQGHCTPVVTMGCSGGTRLAENEAAGITCDAGRFERVFSTVTRLAKAIDTEDVTISYEDLDLGYAGAPYVALVTVSIRQRAFPLALGFFGQETSLPAVSASLVTEDLFN